MMVMMIMMMMVMMVMVKVMVIVKMMMVIMVARMLMVRMILGAEASSHGRHFAKHFRSMVPFHPCYKLRRQMGIIITPML